MLDLCCAIVGEDEKGYISSILEKVATRVPAPILVDSTEADVVEEALKRIPGKAIINSINLEDGEKRTSKVLPMVLAAAGAWWFRGREQSGSRTVKFLRLTDFAGMEESPAFSPDGKSVAFVSDSTGSRQVWVRLLAGGPPLQITNGEGSHLFPRWSQDSAAIIYFTPPPEGTAQGTLWEVSALGGTPRQLVSSMAEMPYREVRPPRTLRIATHT